MSTIQDIKDSWGWIGIEPEEIVGENDFGNLMIKDVEGKYWRLCPEDVYLEVVAANREELDNLSRNQEFLEDWYMRALVEQAESKFSSLKPGYKYYLVIPAVLGGGYDISNINTAPLSEIIRLSGHIAKEIKDLPDGAKIELKVT